MTERKPHPDNDLIDQAEQDSVPTAQAGRSGGNVARTVGTRAELHQAEGQLANLVGAAIGKQLLHRRLRRRTLAEICHDFPSVHVSR